MVQSDFQRHSDIAQRQDSFALTARHLDLENPCGCDLTLHLNNACVIVSAKHVLFEDGNNCYWICAKLKEEGQVQRLIARIGLIATLTLTLEIANSSAHGRVQANCHVKQHIYEHLLHESLG